MSGSTFFPAGFYPATFLPAGYFGAEAAPTPAPTPAPPPWAWPTPPTSLAATITLGRSSPDSVRRDDLAFTTPEPWPGTNRWTGWAELFVTTAGYPGDPSLPVARMALGGEREGQVFHHERWTQTLTYVVRFRDDAEPLNYLAATPEIAGHPPLRPLRGA